MIFCFSIGVLRLVWRIYKGTVRISTYTYEDAVLRVYKLVRP